VRTLRFILPAELEMIEAARFYEEQAWNLGRDFLRTVEYVIHDLRDRPFLWPVVRANVRKRTTPRFPYAVLYRVDAQEIIIVAVMHMHRNPNYWLGRL
jgi:plasmid stabilization system protein ParE